MMMLEFGNYWASYKYQNNYQQPITETEPAELTLNDMLQSCMRKYLPDGTVHLIKIISTKTPGMMYSNNDQDKQIEVYDIDLKKIWSGLEKDNPHDYIKDPLKLLAMSTYRDEISRYATFTPEFSRELVVPVATVLANNTTYLEENWKYSQSGFFTGYDNKGRIIGYISANSFSPNKSDIEPIEKPLDIKSFISLDSACPLLIWLTETKVYQFDFAKRSCDLMYQCDAPIRLIRFFNWPGTEDQQDNIAPVIYAQGYDNQHFLHYPQAGNTINIKPPQTSNLYDFAGISRHENKFYMFVSGETGRPDPRYEKAFEQWLASIAGKPRSRYSQLHRVNTDGTSEKLSELKWDLTKRIYYNPGSSKTRQAYQRIRNITSASSPAILMIFANAFRDMREEYVYNRGVKQLVLEIIRETSPSSILLGLMCSLIATAAAFLHAWPRRTTNASLAVWLIFVAMFSLSGLLTYLALNHHKLIKCAKCGNKRHLRSDNCNACSAPLPTPAKRPTDLILTNTAPPAPA